MSIFTKLSRISRTRKLELFNKLMKPTKQMRILDVGAEINPTGQRGLQLIDSYPWENNLSAINLSSELIALCPHWNPTPAPS